MSNRRTHPTLSGGGGWPLGDDAYAEPMGPLATAASAERGGGSRRTRDASRFWLKRLRLNEHGKVLSLSWHSYGTQYRRAVWVRRYRDRGFRVEIHG